MECEEGKVRNIATGECSEMVSLTPQTTTTTPAEEKKEEVEKDDFDKAIDELKTESDGGREFIYEVEELMKILCMLYEGGGRRKSRKRRKKRGGGCSSKVSAICNNAKKAYMKLKKDDKKKKLNELIDTLRKTYNGNNVKLAYVTSIIEQCKLNSENNYEPPEQSGGRRSRKRKRRKRRKTRRKRKKSRRKSRRRKRRTKRRR